MCLEVLYWIDRVWSSIEYVCCACGPSGVCSSYVVSMHTMSSGKSLQLLCIFPFGMLCLSTISMTFVKIILAVCILVGKVV